MKKKFILSIVAAVAVISVCGVLAFSHIKANGNEVDLKETNKLKVYVYKDDSYMNYILREFNKYYTDINVEKVTFDNYEQYISQLKQDECKKGGPDIIFDSMDNGINLRKMQINDKLVDLKPLLSKDKDFVFEDYNDAAFNACSYDGKLTAVPTSYFVPAVYGSEKSAASDTLKKGCSLNDFIESSLQNSKNKKAVFSSKSYISQLTASCGIDFIDYKNKKMINEDKLKELMADCRKLYSKNIESINSMKSTVDNMKSNSFLFANPLPGASILASTEMDSAYKQYAGCHAEIFAMPSEHSRKQGYR